MSECEGGPSPGNPLVGSQTVLRQAYAYDVLPINRDQQRKSSQSRRGGREYTCRRSTLNRETHPKMPGRVLCRRVHPRRGLPPAACRVGVRSWYCLCDRRRGDGLDRIDHPRGPVGVVGRKKTDPSSVPKGSVGSSPCVLGGPRLRGIRRKPSGRGGLNSSFVRRSQPLNSSPSPFALYVPS